MVELEFYSNLDSVTKTKLVLQFTHETAEPLSLVLDFSTLFPRII